MNKLSPVLMVDDVKKSIEFYKNVLGFAVTMVFPDESNPGFAGLANGQVEIMLQQRASLEEEYPIFSGKALGGTFTLFIETASISSLYDACKSSNSKIVKDMHKTFYGTDEFAVADNDGYVVVFSQK